VRNKSQAKDRNEKREIEVKDINEKQEPNKSQK
jgi:hypothetical protein